MYQALYRKWRSRTFDEVVGQTHITETLKQQVITGHLSHAYLFVGTRGTGKTTCARILAKAVNCQQPVNGSPCNVCRFCRGIDDGSVTDVVELDAASNNGVDSVRQLRDEALFSPAMAKKRVYIIDEVHMLSTPAFNALLKILEEPPEHLMFILATTELQKVPATILSRCQRHAFKRLDTRVIMDRLRYVAGQEGLQLTDDAAALLAGLSEGGMRDALSMLDQCAGHGDIDTDTVYNTLGLAGNREIAALLEHVARHDSAGAVARFGRLWQDGKDPATLLGELSGLLRDLLMCAVAPKGGRALRSGNYDDALLDSFRTAFSKAELIAHIGCIQAALADMRAGQARMICELCLITLCEPGLSDTLPMLRARVEALEREMRQGVPVATAQVPAFEPGEEDASDVPGDVPEPTPQPEVREVEAEPVSPPATPMAEEKALPSPAPAQTAPEAGDFWQRVKAQTAAQLPAGISLILDDPSQAMGRLVGDTLRLSVDNPFAKNMLDRPEVTGLLARNAGAMLGRSVRVEVAEEELAAAVSEGERDRKLAELGRFPIVKFK